MSRLKRKRVLEKARLEKFMHGVPPCGADFAETKAEKERLCVVT